MMVALGWIFFVVLPLVLLGWLAWTAYSEYRPDRIPILVYHRLISKADVDRGAVRDDEPIYACYDTRFSEQMRFLAERGYTTLNLDDYLEIRSGRKPRPEKPILITFDDGYVSNYTLAYPELQRHGFKATIFAVPEPNEYSVKCVEGVDGFMVPEQMRELAENGISIQSHTLTHSVLSELSEPDVRRELSESREKIAAITGRSVDHIAIPRAGYAHRVRRLVAAVGYRTACCNNKGTSHGRSDPLALPRIVVERDMQLADFAACLTPRVSLMLKVVGDVKRIPERLGGARSARALRKVLYFGPFRMLFETRNLKKLVLGGMVLYLIGSMLFLWNVATR